MFFRELFSQYAAPKAKTLLDLITVIEKKWHQIASRKKLREVDNWKVYTEIVTQIKKASILT